MKSEPIYILVEHGIVWEIKNIPSGTQVVVIDKDVEGEEPERLSISPVDGELCRLTTFGPYESEPH